MFPIDDLDSLMSSRTGEITKYRTNITGKNDFIITIIIASWIIDDTNRTAILAILLFFGNKFTSTSL